MSPEKDPALITLWDRLYVLSALHLTDTCDCFGTVHDGRLEVGENQVWPLRTNCIEKFQPVPRFADIEIGQFAQAAAEDAAVVLVVVGDDDLRNQGTRCDRAARKRPVLHEESPDVWTLRTWTPVSAPFVGGLRLLSGHGRVAPIVVVGTHLD